MNNKSKKIALSALISSILIIFFIFIPILIIIYNREAFWYYDTGNDVYSVAISSDGSYFAASI